ncbi:hypothetical protein RJ640_023585 [Escallonia rubra]|uniref:Uncharacterized protein n=1 Tax=Escallonia rubra TaxID=112253 RepID=A0AA88UDQ2_9ASTE|nr:hypothetical protein RJ640_023585 [Escallonia rubra]
MDTIINKTHSLLFEDHLDLEADDSNAAKEYALTLVAKVISPKKVNAKLAHSILLKAWNPSKASRSFSFLLITPIILQAVEVLWTPQNESDTLSERELLEDYPLLRPL